MVRRNRFIRCPDDGRIPDRPDADIFPEQTTSVWTCDRRHRRATLLPRLRHVGVLKKCGLTRSLVVDARASFVFPGSLRGFRIRLKRSSGNSRAVSLHPWLYRAPEV